MVKNALHSLSTAAGAALATAVLGLAWSWLSTAVLTTYGLALFLAMPFGLGYVAALLYGARRRRSMGASIGVGLLATAATAALLVAVAAEGAICIAMAIPLALPLAAAGAAVAHRGRRAGAPGVQAFGAIAVAVPLLMGVEAGADRRPVPHPVTTSIVVDAPPETVWRHVVEFPPLPPPTEAAFRAGIAYPTSATIEGRGPGAVRRCRFSTGDFVEPITVWDRPRRLAFSVAEQPAPMRELSPWGDVHPPHLDGFLRSRRGEFRLKRLPGGRTLLEGTTWYENRMWPARYWQAWSDGLIHTIHRRVLRHVAAQAEREAAA